MNPYSRALEVWKELERLNDDDMRGLTPNIVENERISTIAQAIREAVAEENKACLKIALEEQEWPVSTEALAVADRITIAIRARSGQPAENQK